jgi:hypothetical protein
MNASYNKNLAVVVEVLMETVLVTTNLESRSVSRRKYLLRDLDCDTGSTYSIARRSSKPSGGIHFN